MGRHQSDHHPSLVVQSSIALLQERFRQLQKVKEMREERELVRLLSLSNPKKHGLFNTCVLFEPSVATMMMLPTTTTTTTTTKMLTLPQTSLSLWPTSPSPGKNLAVGVGVGVGVDVDVPALMNLWPVDNVTTSTTSSCDSAISLISKLEHDHESDSDIDVDTSLHL